MARAQVLGVQLHPKPTCMHVVYGRHGFQAQVLGVQLHLAALGCCQAQQGGQGGGRAAGCGLGERGAGAGRMCGRMCDGGGGVEIPVRGAEEAVVQRGEELTGDGQFFDSSWGGGGGGGVRWA